MAENQIEPNGEPVKPKKLLNRLLSNKSTRFVLLCVIFIVLIFLSLTIVLAYYCWLIAIPSMTQWGFAVFKSDTFLWGLWSVVKGIFAVLGIITAAMIPISPFTLIGNSVSAILDRFSSAAETNFERYMESNKKKQNEYEDILRKEEATGLITLVNFSKYELEQYYQIGLEQGRRSYRTSLLAMWIGFVILLFGILLFIIPASGVFLVPEVNKGNVQILTMSSGIVSELIAGLFLWIYKSSKNQLTYFYNRQIFIHNSLLAYKIATTMDRADKKDHAKQVIIEKILAFGTVSSGITPEEETPARHRRSKRAEKTQKPAGKTESLHL